MKALFLTIALSVLNLLALIAVIIYFTIYGGINLFLPGLGLIISLDLLLILFLAVVEIVLIVMAIYLYWSNQEEFLK